jgi:hypothetical protein
MTFRWLSGPGVSIRRSGSRPVGAALDEAVWPLVFVTNDRSLPMVPGPMLDVS